MGVVLFEFILSDNKKNNFDYQNASVYVESLNDSLEVNLNKNTEFFRNVCSEYLEELDHLLLNLPKLTMGRDINTKRTPTRRKVSRKSKKGKK